MYFKVFATQGGAKFAARRARGFIQRFLKQGSLNLNGNEGTVMDRKQYFTTYRIVFIAVAAAMVYVLTMFRFPLLGSKVHFANAMCLLSGLLFGPLSGGLAAGIGSGLYDLLNGYGIDEAVITTVSKFAMAAVCAVIARTGRSGGDELQDVTEGGAVSVWRGLWDKAPRIIVGCIVGALSYVALYMLKTFVYQHFVYGNPLDGVFAVMLGKLPASLINAVFAMIVAPILYIALRRPLQRSGLLAKLH